MASNDFLQADRGSLRNRRVGHEFFDVRLNHRDQGAVDDAEQAQDHEDIRVVGSRSYYADVFMVLGLLGIIYGALVAMVQPDIKKLVAYSSVSHMGYIVMGRAQCYGSAVRGLQLCVGFHDSAKRAHARFAES